jgi:hypothetical protein
MGHLLPRAIYYYPCGIFEWGSGPRSTNKFLKNGWCNFEPGIIKSILEMESRIIPTPTKKDCNGEVNLKGDIYCTPSETRDVGTKKNKISPTGVDTPLDEKHVPADDSGTF